MRDLFSFSPEKNDEFLTTVLISTVAFDRIQLFDVFNNRAEYSMTSWPNPT